MGFSDQSHINRVRDALWQRPVGATVMVGAGFSTNAESKRPAAQAPPTWEDLAEGMYQHLYPGSMRGTRGSARAIASQSSGALRLAQEFEAASGRPKLHGHLQAMIRDADFVPGNAHSQLLKLPWRDVFTTNWDTLLERASPAIVERHYSIVRSLDEIPLAACPRIVKLHGSVDARFPLICTEEDYRTYPARFAPFVNTVQQAMMETLLVLIGFSGDDPNFLHWSGWVRDNLGSSAPKIYLAGWLDLSTHRRRMLEERNIVPIDLAGHPKAGKWRRYPRHVQHAYATDWILRTLDSGRPYDIANWPFPDPEASRKPPKRLRPLQQKIINEPKAEPALDLEQRKSPESKRDAILTLVDVWRYNRTKTYPGWLSAPARVRGMMGVPQKRAEPILGIFPQLDTTEQLRTLYELIWRWEIQLEPISDLEPVSSKLAETARGVLAQVDCQRQEIDGEAAPDADWTPISEAWVAVALALATAARFRFDADEFDQRISEVSNFQDNGQDIKHRIHHERCLWAIFALDFDSLERLLAKWGTKNCDPVWMMRKAALLFEIGHDAEAQELNKQALHDARSVPASDTDVAAQSREAWALCCARATLGFKGYWKAATESWRRWAELTRFHCNAPLEMQFCAQDIQGKSGLEKGPHFDLEMAWKGGLSFSRDEYRRWAASHRALRLAEIAGLPPCAGNMVVAAENMRLAARQLLPHEPELAARLVLREANYKMRGTLNFVLSRARVAVIPDQAVQRLADICLHAIASILPRIAAAKALRPDHWRQRLPVIMEALSRFVLRLDADKVNSVLSNALDWYANEDVAATMQISGPLRNLLLRTWEALPQARRTERTLDLFESPLVGMDGFEAGFVRGDGTRSFIKRYPDPCEALARHQAGRLARTTRNRARLKNVVNALARGLKGGVEARRRAANRMSDLLEVVIPTAGEYSKIAQALWGDDFASYSEMPAGTDIHEWAFLLFPEPMQGLAAERFRAKWLKAARQADVALPECEETLWQVGQALGNLRARGKPLLLSDPERSILADAIEQWAELPVPAPVPRRPGESAAIFPDGTDVKGRNAIAGLEYALLEIGVSEEVARKLYKKVQRLNESETPARGVYAGLIRVMPELVGDIVGELRSALASDTKNVARNAARGLEMWLRSASDEAVGVVPPPTELVREIGVIIAARRKSALGDALRIAKWIFTDGSDEHRNAIGDLAAEGLGRLAHELEYGTRQDEDIDVPFLRWRCTQLAIVMSKRGFDANSAVIRWRKEATDDPLPELRYVDKKKC